MKTLTPIQQLEIGVEGSHGRRQRQVPLCRPARARWWFAQMRRVVDQAVDWPARPALPSEQSSAGVRVCEPQQRKYP